MNTAVLSRTHLAIIVIAILLPVGCGGNDLTTVSGTVTYQGQPLREGRVGFLPDEGRPAFGDLENGKFSLTSYKSNDGALPGHHRVLIQSDKPADPDDPMSDRIPLIPARYGDPDTSGLIAEVKPGQSNVFHFKLVD